MGQQHYERALFAALQALDSSVQVTSRVIRSIRSRLEGDVRMPLSLLGVSGIVAKASAAWAYRGAEVVHRCDLRLPPALDAAREVVTIHDLAFWHFGDEGAEPTSSLRLLNRSRLVLTPSEFSARECRQVLGLPDVRAIHNGVDPAFFSAPHLTHRQREQWGLEGRYVFYGGGSTQRKNLRALADAWRYVAAAVPDVVLVLAGPEDARKERLFANVPRARMVGRLPRDVQVSAVAAADALVVPSLYEGFGFPAVEAMAAGTAVVAANRASLPEICGDAALLTEPTPEGLADGLLTVLTDEERRQGLVARGAIRAPHFSWAECARKHLAVYAELLAGSA